MSVCMRKRAQWEKVKSVSVHKGPEHTYVITLRVNEVEIERERATYVFVLAFARLRLKYLFVIIFVRRQTKAEFLIAVSRRR